MITGLCSICGAQIYKSVMFKGTWVHRETIWKGHAAKADPVRHSGERPVLTLVRGGLSVGGGQ